MKIEVGKKYKMKNYPLEYSYVLIVCKESDLGVEETVSNYSNEASELFSGVIIYESKALSSGKHRYPELFTWGENGEWDGAFLDDCNALIKEHKPQ